jgi:hypothetical protein
MDIILDGILCNGSIFSILVIAVILMTRTKRNADKCSFRTCLQSLIADLKADEMNRLKGATLLLIAVAVGGAIKAMEIGPLWLRESFAQCAYMFGSAVAAVFIRSGYEAAAHKDEK